MEERTERLREYRGFVSEVLDLMKKENIDKASSRSIFNGRKLIVEKAKKELHLSNRRSNSCINLIYDIYKSRNIEYYLSNDLFIINVFENESFEDRTASGIGNYLSKSMRFYSKNYDDLVSENQLEKFDNVTLKKIKNNSKTKLSAKELQRFNINFEECE